MPNKSFQKMTNIKHLSQVAMNIAIALFIQDIAPEYILFETLQDLTGGQAVLMLGAFAHVADISDPKYRTSRMAVLEFL